MPGEAEGHAAPCATARSAGDAGWAPRILCTFFFIFYLFNLLEGTSVNGLHISGTQRYNPTSVHAIVRSPLGLVSFCHCVFDPLSSVCPPLAPPSPLVTSILLSVSMRLL